MNWLSFLAPSWAWLGLLALPLILLYILRIKRPDLTVSSTLLWSKALADMRASTPFQKLRRNLLLLLQLLILAALVLTLMRPVVQAKATQTHAGVIVIDASASMQTHDNGGPSRLDRAKDQAKKLVDSMRPGDRFMLVSDGGGLNHGGIGFTNSKSELNSEIDKIKPSDTPSDLYESLLLAATSLRGINSDSGTPRNDALTAGKVWLFSDGAGVRVPDAMNADNNATGGGATTTNSLLQFVKIGESNHSVGITQLSITPVAKQPRTYEVFVGVQNAWDVEKKVGVVLALNTEDNFLPGQAKTVTLPPHGQGSITFESVVADPGKLFVIADPTNDDFPLDNTAYALLEPARKVKVLLVSNGGGVLENFVKTGVRVGAFDGQIIAPAAYAPGFGGGGQADLVILDGFAPPLADMPKADTLLIRPPVTGGGAGAVNVGGFNVTSEVENPAVLRWKREDPVMQFVELGSLRLSKALVLEKDPDLVDLVSSPESSLIAYKDFGSTAGGGTRRYFLSFSPQIESNWWMDPSLLIFLQNIIEQTRIRHYIGLPEMLSSGSAAKLWNVGDDKGGGDGPVRITAPDGSVSVIQAKDGAAEFPATDKVGFYTVTSPGGGGGGGGKTATFAVNLLSSTESNIQPQSLQTASGAPVSESPSIATINLEVWPWVASAALAILVLEWWVYHRRIA
ncbi:MAG TPA: VWA domain-containing protein [Phycisphaerae bacterium]|nr:VWA domain-containing protein [Phycisphaerae bacterium]